METMRIEVARSVVSDSERLLLRQFRTVRGDFGNWNLATSVSFEGKGAQETCTSGRPVLSDTGTELLSVRHTHAREEHSPKHLDSGQSLRGLCLGRRKAAGREEPRDPRALESLVVVSGVGECDRVPLGKASGALIAGQ